MTTRVISVEDFARAMDSNPELSSLSALDC